VAPNTEPKFALLLAAGGRGLRFGGGSVPKQFVELLGIPIYVWSLSTLLEHELINSAVVVAPAEMIAIVQEQLAMHARRFKGKPIDVVAGGDTRQKSVYLGLQSGNFKSADYVLIHDAARPFLNREIVDRVVSGVIKYGACTVGISPADTIKKIDGEWISETVSRDSLIQVQTPQAARCDWLLAAHEKAEREGHATTDDAAVLEYAGHRVAVIEGGPLNIKLTQPDDLILAKALASIVLTDRL
jgi:2-C-methyl-D-erythritol 4-phosphate cytidylyltransferase